MKGRTARRKSLDRYVRGHLARSSGDRHLPPCVLRQRDREDRHRRYAYDMRYKRPLVPLRIWQKWGIPEKLTQVRAEVRAAWAECDGQHEGHDVFMCAWWRMHPEVSDGPKEASR